MPSGQAHTPREANVVLGLTTFAFTACFAAGVLRADEGGDWPPGACFEEALFAVAFCLVAINFLRRPPRVAARIIGQSDP